MQIVCKRCRVPKGLTETEIKERAYKKEEKQGGKEDSIRWADHKPKRKKAKNTSCTCNVCGAEFLGTDKRCRFCSPKCRKIGESQYNKEQYKIRKAARGAIK